jgi:ribokinase
MRSLRVVVMGGLNMDLIVRVAELPRVGETVTGEDLLRAPGGKGGNQAVAAARLGARVSMIGSVGADPFGRELTRGLRVASVSTRRVVRSDRPTGAALIVVDHRGQNSIAVAPGSNLSLALEAASQHVLARAEVVIATLEVPLSAIAEAFRMARHSGARTVLNAAPAQPIRAELLSLSDVLICNETELATLVGRPVAAGEEAEAARLLRSDSGEPIVVVTLGKRGAIALGGSGSAALEQAAYAVNAVDTVGAGDAFVAGFVVSRWWSAGVDTALRWGCAAGALATTVSGAQPAMPSLERVRRLLEG